MLKLQAVTLSAPHRTCNKPVLHQQTTPAKPFGTGRKTSVIVRAQQPGHDTTQHRPASAVQAMSSTCVTTTTQQNEHHHLSQEYSRTMKDAMGWSDRPYDYDWSRGLYYHEILPNLYCGSQPRHKEDVKELKNELGLTNIVSLQQDKDMQYWGVDPHEVRTECEAAGISLVRRPVRDFDPHSLRKVLPEAVRAVHDALSSGGRVYVHCTAGLGRAPGVIIAYLYWFHHMNLHQAYELLTKIRPCGPKKDAIRGATFDLLSGRPLEHFDREHAEAWAHINDSERQQVQTRVLEK